MFFKYMISGDVPSHEMILELEKQLTNDRITKWIYHDLFSFQWWVLLACCWRCCLFHGLYGGSMLI
ncbi:MAG: hypothetical protein WC601_06605, partial [Desulfotomaculaceae bacterium]